MTITIEKGVPMPRFNNAKRKYPVNEMEVGDSFFVTPLGDQTIHQLQVSLVGCTRAARVGGKKYTTRTQTVDGVTGIRMWRVA